MAVSVTSLPLTPPSVVKQEIESRVLAAWEVAGYTTEEGLRDTQAMQDAAYAVIVKHVANSKEEIVEKAITRGEFYAAVFPGAPGTDGSGDPVDEYDRAVTEALERDVWSLTQPKSEGALQKRLGEEGLTYVLCREKIRRNLDKADAVYLTDNPHLIMETFVDKEVKAYERKAANLKKQLEMVTKRHEELTSQIKSRVRLAENKNKAELNLAPASTPEELVEKTEE
jgi:hypothetical protein